LNTPYQRFFSFNLSSFIVVSPAALMDPAVGPLLTQIERVGNEVIADSGEGNKARCIELLQVAQKLCIALQNEGQLIDDFLFGVRRHGRASCQMLTRAHSRLTICC